MCVCAQALCFLHLLHKSFAALLLGFLLHMALTDRSFACTCNCQGVRGFGWSGKSPLNPAVPSTALRISRSIIYRQAQLRRQSFFEHL